MKRSIPLILVLSAVMLAAMPLAASAAMPANYAAVKLGAYFPQASDVDELDTGFNGEIAFGRYFHPNFAAELGIGYLRSTGDVKDELTNTIIGSGKLTAIPITLNAKLVYPADVLEFYALAGIGLYYVKAEVDAAGLSDSDTDTAFGYQLGIGGSYNITPNIYFGLEGKYFWAKPSVEFSTLGVPSMDVKIDGIQATANLGYRF